MILAKNTPNSASTQLTSNATTIAARGGRRTLIIINRKGSEVLYVKEGAGCSSTDFSYILVGGTTDNDGYGGSVPIAYTGLVSIYATSTTPLATAVENY
jgi:hypothetical protein